MVRVKLVLTVALVALGCDSMSAPRPTDSGSFSLNVRGDREGRSIGRTVVDEVPYARVDSKGTRVEKRVTMISMIANDTTSLGIGLVNGLSVGRYLPLRPVGALEGKQFYAQYSLPARNGERVVYELTRGVVDITSVSPLRGTFQLKADRLFRWPQDAAIGTQRSPEAGVLEISGSLR